jgi:hypothetical protein
MTARRRDDVGDDLRKVGRPSQAERKDSSVAGTLSTSEPSRSAPKWLIALKLASALVTIPERWAAISAAPTAAAKKQRRGRERPHRPMAIGAPRAVRGVAHALASLSRVGGGCQAVRVPDPCRIRARSCADSFRNIVSGSPPRSFGRMSADAASRTPQKASVKWLLCTLRRTVEAWESRPSRIVILERHAHASSPGAPRRPVRAAGLTRARLALVGYYVMADIICAVFDALGRRSHVGCTSYLPIGRAVRCVGRASMVPEIC